MVGLWATVALDERKPVGTGWVTMADPEGQAVPRRSLPLVASKWFRLG